MLLLLPLQTLILSESVRSLRWLDSFDQMLYEKILRGSYSKPNFFFVELVSWSLFQCALLAKVYKRTLLVCVRGKKRIERRKTNYSITKVFCCSLPNKLPKIMRHYTFCDTPGARNSLLSVHFFHEYITAKHCTTLAPSLQPKTKKYFKSMLPFAYKCPLSK